MVPDKVPQHDAPVEPECKPDINVAQRLHGINLEMRAAKDRVALKEPSRCRLCAPRIIAALALGGLVLALIGVRAAGGQPIWPPDYAYEHALDQAMGARIGELVAIASAYLGAAFILLAAVLLGYWLVRSSHQRHRGAH